MVTVINVFTIRAGADPKEAMAHLIAVNERISQEPGWRSVRAYASRDQSRIANVASWKSEEALRAALGSAALKPLLEELTAVADGDWHLYDEVHALPRG